VERSGGERPFHVLVVEDDAAIARLAVRTLARANYDVRAVATGMDAVGLIGAGHWVPDLVVTDLELPDITGLQLLRWCRHHGQQVPFLVSSGDVAALGKLDGRALGPEVLSKPWELRALDSAVRRMVAR